MNLPLSTSVYVLFFFSTAKLVGTCDSDCGCNAECKKITECVRYVEHIKKVHLTNSIHHRKFMLEHVQHITCGFERKEPKICCPVKKQYSKYEGNKTNTHMKNRSSHSNCGNFLWNKNLPPDGSPTDLHEFPWLALLEYNSSSGSRLGCGGALISERYVLTAASCIQPFLGLAGVRLGEHDLRTSRDCVSDESPGSSGYCNDRSVLYGLKRAIPHESYEQTREPAGLQPHDIALLQLDRSAELGDYVAPICLPGREALKPGKYLAAGWGAGPDSGQPRSSVKRTFRLEAVEQRSCEHVYGRTLGRGVMCASARSSNVGCIGDFGGPLMAVDGLSRMTVVGVFVPVEPGYCWTAGIPNTYTDVREHQDWIMSHMQY